MIIKTSTGVYGIRPGDFRSATKCIRKRRKLFRPWITWMEYRLEIYLGYAYTERTSYIYCKDEEELDSVAEGIMEHMPHRYHGI